MTDEEHDLSCRELIDFIADYLDGALSPGPRRAFEEHLAICPDCVSYLDGYRETIRLGAAAFSEPSELEEVPEDLVHAVLSARRSGG